MPIWNIDGLDRVHPVYRLLFTSRLTLRTATDRNETATDRNETKRKERVKAESDTEMDNKNTETDQNGHIQGKGRVG